MKFNDVKNRNSGAMMVIYGVGFNYMFFTGFFVLRHSTIQITNFNSY